MFKPGLALTFLGLSWAGDPGSAKVHAQAPLNSAKSSTPGRQGNLRSFQANPVPGGRVIVSIQPEGTILKAGDLVCELDSSEFREALQNQAIEIESIEADQKNLRLSVEAAELAVKEEEASLTQESTRLSESLRLAKSAGELIEGRLKASNGVSTADMKALEVARSQSRDIEAEIAKFNILPDRLMPVAQSLERCKSEDRACRVRLMTAQDERRELESRIARCRLTAREAGRVVHARWRPRPATPEGYVVLEPGVVVQEAQPLFRIDPFRGGRPRRRSMPEASATPKGQARGNAIPGTSP